MSTPNWTMAEIGSWYLEGAVVQAQGTAYLCILPEFGHLAVWIDRKELGKLLGW